MDRQAGPAPGSGTPGTPDGGRGGPDRPPRDGSGPQHEHRPVGWHLSFGSWLWKRGPAGDGPLRRGREDRLAGGVAAGLATRTGFDVTTVRLVFVLATLVTFGWGMVVYLLAWLLTPAEGTDRSIASKARSDSRGIAFAVGLASLVLLALIIISLLRNGWFSFAWPLVLSAAGLVLIWRNAPPDEQAIMQKLRDPLLGLAGDASRSRILLRAAAASVLLITGLIILLSGHESTALLQPLTGVLLIIAAIVVGLGHWWLRLARDLVLERQARVRAEERADIASRVHDSVLQTLALIQRRADDPQQVIQLARAQERELRSWLFDGRAPGSLDGAGMTLAAGIRLIQQEVEAQHGMPVEAVTVGDCELSDDLTALLAAAREATVNAAKWSGADAVSLFAEAEPAAVSVYVRDRGRGFDPAAVPGDRMGLAESVHARMARRGGSATVRSALGEGTEVSLIMPRAAGKRQPSRT